MVAVTEDVIIYKYSLEKPKIIWNIRKQFISLRII